MMTPYDFIRGAKPDHRGRYVRDYWRQSSDWMEQTHDFIQWAFPLPVGSRYNPVAPLLTPTDAHAIASDDEARYNFHRNLGMMTGFLARTNRWQRFEDHNHQRITRVLKSTRLILPDGPEALNMFRFLIARSRGHGISSVSKDYWWRVIRPDFYSFSDAMMGD